MTLQTIDAHKTHELLKAGKAVLIDVREPDEWIKEHVPEAHLVPLSGFNPDDFPRDHGKIAVFHCRSGGRTEAAAPQILRTSFREVYQLQGGLQGWRDAGYKVNETANAPISIMRQVQIAAGALVLFGIVLAVMVNPWFAALSAFVGAGLTPDRRSARHGPPHYRHLRCARSARRGGSAGDASDGRILRP